MPRRPLTVVTPLPPAYAPRDVLEKALEEIGDGTRVATKCVVILLDDTDDKYALHWKANDMRCSEVVALVEILQQRIISQDMQ